VDFYDFICYLSINYQNIRITLKTIEIGKKELLWNEIKSIKMYQLLFYEHIIIIKTYKIKRIILFLRFYQIEPIEFYSIILNIYNIINKNDNISIK
jgi:hypothetical protein